MEKSSASQEFPVAKVAYSFLKDNLPSSSSFSFPRWNKGRIVCQRTQLKRLLSEVDQCSGESEIHEVIGLINTMLPLPMSRTSTSSMRKDQHSGSDTGTVPRTRRQKELMSSTV